MAGQTAGMGSKLAPPALLPEHPACASGDANMQVRSGVDGERPAQRQQAALHIVLLLHRCAGRLNRVHAGLVGMHRLAGLQPPDCVMPLNNLQLAVHPPKCAMSVGRLMQRFVSPLLTATPHPLV